MKKLTTVLLGGFLLLSNITLNNVVYAEEEPEETNEETSEVIVPQYVTGVMNVVSDEYEVIVTLDESNEIPEGTTLSVQEIQTQSDEYNTYVENAAAKVLEEGDTLPYARFFDISFINTIGETIEPKGNVNVQIDLKDHALETEDVTFQAVHFIEEDNTIETEVIDVQTDEVVSFEAESFSTYGVIYFYTVDFYYGESEYHMNGGGRMYLSELFEKLDIHKNVSDITNLDFTNPEVLTFVKENDDYLITSLEPFSTLETLTITFNDEEELVIGVEDAIPSGGVGGTLGRGTGGNCYWYLNTDGLLTIRPTSGGGWSGSDADDGYARLGKDNGTNWGRDNGQTEWPWNAYRSDITAVRTLGTIEVIAGTNLNYMFADMPNLESVDLHGLDTTKAQGMKGMFMKCGSDALETLDLSTFESDNRVYQLQDMFNGCKAKKIILNNPNFQTRLQSGSTSGCQSQRMFANCNNLEEVDISNITISGWNDTDQGRYQSFGGSADGKYNGAFESLPNLKKVNMQNIQLPGMTTLRNLFAHCPKLQEVDMSGAVDVSDVKDMYGMFYNSFTTAAASGEENIANISGFGATGNVVSVAEMFTGCTELNVIDISNWDNSAIEPRLGYHEYPEEVDWVRWGKNLNINSTSTPNLKKLIAENSKVWMCVNSTGSPGMEPFNAAYNSNIVYFTKNQMTYESSVGPTEEIVTIRDYVDLLTDRQETGERGADDHGENTTNINMKDGHLNTAGASFVAPGTYTIKDIPLEDPKPEATETYYRITKMGTTTPTISVLHEQLRLNGNTVTTIEQSKDVWGTDPDGEYVIGDGKDTIIRITYPNVATDIYGDTHDVVVEVKQITFKNVGLVPTTGEDDEGYDRRNHDENKVAVDEYYRTVLQALDDKLQFNNYARSTRYRTSTGRDIEEDAQVLSNGSGTYIDFDIKISDASEGQSLLFYIDDLDVPHAQNWILDPDDACYDSLPWSNVEYGSGSEGMILGKGNDIDTLSFADHTGLQVLNHNEVVATGSDPSTAWSEFYVRSEANGSRYTWTSGISCTTDLLKNTLPANPPKKVYLMPDALKHVNDAIPAGVYAEQYFTFNLNPSDETGTNYKDHTGIVDLPNKADVTQTDKKNHAELIPFEIIELNVPESDTPDKYIYEITEEPGSTTEDIIKYDDETKFYIQIVVYRPTDDMEMYQGTRAEIILGEKHGDKDIVWKPDYVITVYSSDAQPTEDPDVYVDANGTKFKIEEGKYYDAETGEELTLTKHTKVDRTLEYEGSTYTVYVDHNGIEYFQDSEGKYRDPNHPEREMIKAREGDIDPSMVKDDSLVAEPKMVNGKEVRQDVHGIEYYVDVTTYYDLDGNKRTVEDGVFNPDDDYDKHVEQNRKVNGQDVYRHVNGVEYIVVDDKYYDANDPSKELTIKTLGEVDPLPSDDTAKANEVVEKELKEGVTGNGYLVKEDHYGNQYYFSPETNIYYTRYGTIIGTAEEIDRDVFDPQDSDPTVTMEREIWIDGSGRRFYKSERKYYDEATDEETELSNGTLDTSEIIYAGTFNNITKTSEMKITKVTTDDKTGTFKVLVKFDNGFEPKFVSYEPASTAINEDSPKKHEQVSEDTWAFYLDDGQTVTIKEIPFYTTYTVYEPEDENGWQLIKIDGDESKKEVSNKITKQPTDPYYDGDYEHTLTNQFTEVILKKVVAQGDKNKDFVFKVEFTVSGYQPNSKVTLGFGTMDENDNHKFTKKTVTTDDSGEALVPMNPIELRDGKDIVLVIPRNSMLKIQEQLDGYEVSITGDIAIEKDEDHGIAIINIEEITDKPPHVTYTNRNEGPTVDNCETTDLVDRVQSATFTITKGTGDITSKQLIDPYTDEPTDESEVDALDENREKIGTYKYVPETNLITFTPNRGYVGTPEPGRILVKDESGNTATGEYQPNVVDPMIPPTATNDKTTDIQGKTQTGYITVSPGSTPFDKFQLIDPYTGEPTDALEIDALDSNGKVIGKYKFDPSSGKENPDGSITFSIIFVPNADFVGTPRPAILRATDTDGLFADGVYQPVVTPIKPTPTNNPPKPGAPGIWVPFTGDQGHFLLYGSLFVSSILLSLFLLLFIRKNTAHS